jgi:hypothetical protein
VAGLDDGAGDVVADLGLGAPGDQPPRDLLVHGVDGRARGAQRGHLGVVLAHPQLAQHRCRELDPGAGQGVAQAEDVQGGHVGGDRDAPRPAEPRRREGVGVDAVGPGQHVHRLDRRAGEPRALERGDHERGLAVDRQEQRREPLVGVLDDAGEVLQVRARRHDQGVHADLPRRGPGALEPGRHPIGGGGGGAAHGRRA